MKDCVNSRKTHVTNGMILDSTENNLNLSYRTILLDTPDAAAYCGVMTKDGIFPVKGAIDRSLDNILIQLKENDGKKDLVISNIPSRLDKKIEVRMVKIESPIS